MTPRQVGADAPERSQPRHWRLQCAAAPAAASGALSTGSPRFVGACRARRAAAAAGYGPSIGPACNQRLSCEPWVQYRRPWAVGWHSMPAPQINWLHITSASPSLQAACSTIDHWPERYSAGRNQYRNGHRGIDRNSSTPAGYATAAVLPYSGFPSLPPTSDQIASAPDPCAAAPPVAACIARAGPGHPE